MQNITKMSGAVWKSITGMRKAVGAKIDTVGAVQTMQCVGITRTPYSNTASHSVGLPDSKVMPEGCFWDDTQAARVETGADGKSHSLEMTCI